MPTSEATDDYYFDFAQSYLRIPAEQAHYAAMTARELAAAIGASDVEAVYFTLRHLSANESAQRLEAPEPSGVRFYR